MAWLAAWLKRYNDKLSTQSWAVHLLNGSTRIFELLCKLSGPISKEATNQPPYQLKNGNTADTNFYCSSSSTYNSGVSSADFNQAQDHPFTIKFTIRTVTAAADQKQKSSDNGHLSRSNWIRKFAFISSPPRGSFNRFKARLPNKIFHCPATDCLGSYPPPEQGTPDQMDDERRDE